jgi:hypothetical protein
MKIVSILFGEKTYPLFPEMTPEVVSLNGESSDIIPAKMNQN